MKHDEKRLEYSSVWRGNLGLRGNAGYSLLFRIDFCRPSVAVHFGSWRTFGRDVLTHRSVSVAATEDYLSIAWLFRNLGRPSLHCRNSSLDRQPVELRLLWVYGLHPIWRLRLDAYSLDLV